MVPRHLTCFLLAALAVSPALAQRRVSPDQSYERAWAVVPILGSGTSEDPFRPKYAPVSSTAVPGNGPAAAARPGIIGFAYELSDDGKHALVLFVASTKDGLKELLGDNQVQAFVRGRDKDADIVSALGKYKKNFKIDDLRVGVQ